MNGMQVPRYRTEKESGDPTRQTNEAEISEKVRYKRTGRKKQWDQIG